MKLVLDREIGIFNCTFERELLEPEMYLIVDRESKLMNYRMYVWVIENSEGLRLPDVENRVKLFARTSK